MSQYDSSSKNISANNNLDNERNINNCKEIFLMIDEHKKKLEELKNSNSSNNSNISKPENQKFYFNKKEKKSNSNLNIINNQSDIDNSINLAKYFLQKNKEKTIKIFNNIDNKITPYLGLHFNYDEKEENKSNNVNYDTNSYNKTYYSFLKQNATEPNTTKNKNKSINNISLLYNNSNKLIRSNSRVYTNSNILFNNDINEDLNKSKKNIFNKKGENLSEIKLLKDKLKRREEKIKKLESNIDSLNKENQSLKQYIIELQHNLLTYTNKNIFSNIDSVESSGEEHGDIQDKAEKIMNSINIFIKKIYNLFPNLGCTDDFKELSYHQPNEVEKKLDKIEKMIHDSISLKKTQYNSNESSILDVISTIEYDKNGLKKPKYKNLIKKLESKSSKKAIKKKNKIAYELNYSGCPCYKNKNKNKSNNY